MDTPPNLSIAKGDPKPLLPLGGNLADLTNFLASSAVSSRGTIIPWAGIVMGFSGQATAQDSHEPPESKAPTYDQRHVMVDAAPCERFTIQPSLAATLTIGLTPHAAMAATASCIAPSAPHVSGGCHIAAGRPSKRLPSMFPCSVSTQIQSNPHRATVLAWLLPGSICHAPKVRPEEDRRAFWIRLAACISVVFRFCFFFGFLIFGQAENETNCL